MCKSFEENGGKARDMALESNPESLKTGEEEAGWSGLITARPGDLGCQDARAVGGEESFRLQPSPDSVVLTQWSHRGSRVSPTPAGAKFKF